MYPLPDGERDMKIQFEKSESSYRVTLNDPPLNILDIDMLSELRDALQQVQDDRAALIIAAAGEKAFSAGASVHDHLGERARTMLAVFHQAFRILSRLDLIIICLVKGPALGGGCELAMACDFVLASDRARFGQPEINLGVFPPVAAYQMSRQTAPRRGLELLLTGDPIDASTALQLGLINAAFPYDQFDIGAEQWMARLMRQSASSLRLAKRAFRLAAADQFDQKLASVERLYLEELMQTNDATEGLNAFLEKRQPVWKHR